MGLDVQLGGAQQRGMSLGHGGEDRRKETGPGVNREAGKSTLRTCPNTELSQCCLSVTTTSGTNAESCQLPS